MGEILGTNDFSSYGSKRADVVCLDFLRKIQVTICVKIHFGTHGDGKSHNEAEQEQKQNNKNGFSLLIWKFNSLSQAEDGPSVCRSPAGFYGVSNFIVLYFVETHAPFIFAKFLLINLKAELPRFFSSVIEKMLFEP